MGNDACGVNKRTNDKRLDTAHVFDSDQHFLPDRKLVNKSARVYLCVVVNQGPLQMTMSG